MSWNSNRNRSRSKSKGFDRNEGHGVDTYVPLPSKNSMQQIQAQRAKLPLNAYDADRTAGFVPPPGGVGVSHQSLMARNPQQMPIQSSNQNLRKANAPTLSSFSGSSKGGSGNSRPFDPRLNRPPPLINRNASAGNFNSSQPRENTRHHPYAARPAAAAPNVNVRAAGNAGQSTPWRPPVMASTPSVTHQLPRQFNPTSTPGSMFSSSSAPHMPSPILAPPAHNGPIRTSAESDTHSPSPPPPRAPSPPRAGPNPTTDAVTQSFMDTQMQLADEINAYNERIERGIQAAKAIQTEFGQFLNHVHQLKQREKPKRLPGSN